MFLLILPGTHLYSQPAGFPGTALTFDGTNDYVSGSGFNTSITAITVEAWVNLNSLPVDEIERFVTINPEVAVLRYDGTTYGGTDELHFYIKRSNGDLYSLRVDNVLTTGIWMHIAGTYDGNTMKLYLNGTEIASATPAGGLYAPDGNFTFSSSSTTMDGTMDEIRVWNLARTQQQIRENMHLTLAGSETGLQNYLQMNEGSGSTVSDAVGNCTGTMYNMAAGSWVTSTIPVGVGVSNTQTEAAGTIAFTGTGFTANYSSQNGASVTVSKLNLSPNINPNTFDDIFDDQYWVINRFGTGTFTADLSFTVNESFTSNDVNHPQLIRLYRRDSNSDAAWTYVTAASSVSTSQHKAVFSGVTETGQFMITRIVSAGKAVNVSNGYYWFKIDPNSSLDVGNSLTLEAWIMPIGLTSRRPIYSTRYFDEVGTWMVEAGPGENGSNCLAVSGPGTWIAQTVDNVISPGKWYHITYTRWGSSAGQQAFYVNGKKVELVTDISYTFQYHNILKYIGHSDNYDTHLYQGKLDEVSLWNDVRTETEILNDMNFPLAGNENDLVFNYQFSETNWNMAFSTTGNNTANAFNGSIVRVESFAMVIPTVGNAVFNNPAYFVANWTAPLFGIWDSYKLYVATDSTFTNMVTGYNPKTIDGSLTSETIDCSAYNGYYYFRVCADKSSVTGQGTYSDKARTDIVPAPGSGTSNDPYLISCVGNLHWISSNTNLWNKYFLQTANIDAIETEHWYSGSGFSPIGNSTTKFSGTYNGQGFTIDGLYINRPSADNIGFFGYAQYSTLHNIGLTNTSITGNSYVGGLVGYVTNASVLYCFTTGEITGTGDNVGGLIGRHCCENLNNCFSRAIVHGNDVVGGLIGNQYSDNTLQFCYAQGQVLATQSAVGGLFGSVYTAINESSYWDTEESGLSNAYGTITGSGTVEAWGKTTLQMKQQSTYTGWDFAGETANGTNDYWVYEWNYNDGFPRLYYPTKITTQAASNVGELQADCNIEVTFTGITLSTDYGFCWDTLSSPNVSGNHVSYGAPTATGTYSSTVTGLNPGKTYYYRSYYTNEFGTKYSNQVSFTTDEIGKWPGGEGTESNPYRIANLDNLYWLSMHSGYWNLLYVQTADINAAGTKTWDSGAGFSPIGNNGTKFTGTYNGQKYEIDSLYVIRPSASYVGFFGYTDGAIIDSLGITNDSIVGSGYVGGFVGRTSSNSQIAYCYATGTVRANAGYSGGFAGYIGSSGLISNCYSQVDIYSTSYDVGGFAGISYSPISNCYSSGTVTGDDYVGGFIGFVSSGTEILNCYARGQVTGDDKVGGFAGNIYLGSIAKSYCSGFVSGGTSNTYGFVGNNQSGGSINQSYWDTETSGQTAGSNEPTFQIEGKTTAQMNQQSTYVSWDFVGETSNGTDDIWAIMNNCNNGYPCFYFPIYVRTLAIADSTATSAKVHASLTNFGNLPVNSYGACWNTSGSPTLADNYVDNGTCTAEGPFEADMTGLTKLTTYYVRAFAISDADMEIVYGEELSFMTTLPGKGTENDPYLVYTYDDLKGLVYNRGACYMQMADIDASASETENGGDGFQPIGTSSNKFTGKYFGQAYTIDNFHINRSSTDDIGLFGYLSGAEIIDLGLTDVNIHGNENVGGIAGKTESDSEIHRCYVTGDIIGANYYAGGLAGLLTYTDVSLSWSAASVTVTGAQGYLGGLIGKTDHSSLENCYATGMVTIPGIPLYIAGLVGYNWFTNVINCYSTGLVNGNTTFGGTAGGLLASNQYSTVSNSFWDVQTSNKNSSAGGTAKTTAEMKTLTTFTNAGWDFYSETTNGTEDYWNKDVSVNSGYPHLRLDTYLATLTTEISSQHLDYASIKGTILTLGNPQPMQHGICWNTTGTPTISDNKTEKGLINTIGDFYSAVTGMELNTTYYARAYVTNRSVVSYGNEISFHSSQHSGGCVHLNGGAEVIRVNNNPGISVGNTFSVEVWVKPTALDLRYVVYSNIKYSSLTAGYQIEVGPGDGGTNCVTLWRAGSWIAQTENNVVEMNKWNHIVYSRASGTQQNIFVNGFLIPLVTDNNLTISDNSYDRAIGSGLSSLVYNFIGDIDELRIWNYALTQEEIRERMYKTLAGDETGLVEYWKFDERNGLTTQDEKTNRAGTLNNTDSSAFVPSTAPIPFHSDTDGDWADTANWQSGQGYPANVWSRAEINSDLTLDNNIELIDLSIANGKSLTISPGTGLTVSGDLVNDAGISGLVLKSDASGTATIIQNSSGVDASTERYLTQGEYHYISTPVSNQNISPEFVNTTSNPLPSTVDFYKFDEPNNLWRNIKDGSGNLNTTFETQFVIGRGYAYANIDAIYTKEFTGELNYDDLTVNLTKTTSSGSAGWNLVGNPFPANLSANTQADATNNFLSDNAAVLDDDYEAIYLWDGSDYAVISQASPESYISPVQAFFVNAASNGAQLQINANSQKHSAATFYKSQNTLAQFIIGITGPQGDFNQTYISFIPGSTKGRDAGYDARKLKGNPNIALFSKLVDDDGGDYAIQSLPPVENQQVYLGLDAMQPGLYQFENVQQNNLPYQSVMLEDKQENVFVDLNSNPSYSFTTTQTALNLEDRFVIHFGGIVTDIIELSKQTNITIFSDGEFIYIQNLANEMQEGLFRLYNLAGQLSDIRNLAMEGHARVSVPTNNSSGMYLVSFQCANKIYTQKIILK